MVRIHAIQTGTVAIKQGQVEGRGQDWKRRLHMFMDQQWTEPLPIYAWVIEHPEGLVVVDTGETARTADKNYFPSWHPYYRSGVRMDVRPEDEIGPQMIKRGLSPRDVRWVILTHMHTDHAGGLPHFPDAQILVSRAEYRAATGLGGKIAGYLPQHWPAWFAPTYVDFQPLRFGPFTHTYALTRAHDLMLVPTYGHSPGHMSVILPEDEQVVFFAGDVSYSQKLLERQVVDGVSGNAQVARQTLHNVLELARWKPMVYLPSHDPESAHRLAGRQTLSVGEVGSAERR